MPTIRHRPSVLLLAPVVGALVACGGPRQEQLAGGIDLLAGSATELPSREPLVNDQGGGRLCLTPRAPFRLVADSLAIRSPYGAHARPLAVAVRADGGIDSLTMLAARANEDLCLSAPPGKDPRVTYRAVRIESAVDLSLDRVAWHTR